MAILRTLLDGLLYALIFLCFVLLLGSIGQNIIQKAYFDLFLSNIYIFIFLQWFCIISLNSVVFAFIKRHYRWLSVFWETFLIGTLCALTATLAFSAIFRFSQVTFNNTVLDVFLLLMNWHEKGKALLVLLAFFVSYAALFTLLKLIMDRIVWRKYAKVI
ncbi:MAG: hypothetical protein ACFB0B_11735 [Thermonemataceae bacterium]